MQIKYKTKILEKECTNLKEAKKKYSGKIPIGLHAVINFISNAESLADVINYTPFHFHSLKGSKTVQYAIDIAGRRSGYRLIIVPLDNKGKECCSAEVYSKQAVNIVIVHLEEVTNHYE